MTYEQFKKKWLGKGINYDGAYGNQCMDVYRMYVKEVLGYPQSPPVRGAKDVWATYLPKYYSKVPNTPDGVPPQGAIAIWGHGTYGHIGVVDSADKQYLTCFEQNWVEMDGSGVTELRRHNYKNVLGWLIPNAIISPSPQIEEPMNNEIDLGKPWGKMELQALKSVLNDTKRDLDNLKKQAEESTRRYEETQKKYEELLKIHETVKQDFENELKISETLATQRKEELNNLISSLAGKLKCEKEKLVVENTVDKILAENKKKVDQKELRPLSGPNWVQTLIAVIKDLFIRADKVANDVTNK